ncbi:MAG: hypothetical protein ABIO16_16530 [Nocardioides sp.]
MTHDTSRAHEFDFWIGDWDVFGPKGKQVGTSSITALFAGHAGGMLHEHWHGQGGVEGRSLNGYDADRDCWHQTWMDGSGGVLLLDGGLRDGAMVLEAPGQRITWTQEADEVRQVWESSSDEGVTWTVAFDGRYVRR